LFSDRRHLIGIAHQDGLGNLFFPHQSGGLQGARLGSLGENNAAARGSGPLVYIVDA
jgi:hypothetical protein